MLRLLGPIDILVNGRSIDPDGRRQRVVLAVLGMNVNRVTSTEQLIEAIWGEEPPSTAKGQVQICVSALRKLFTDAGMTQPITTRSPGYVLRLDAAELDTLRFTELIAAAKRDADASRIAEAAVSLRDALALWRGQAFAGVDSEIVERGAVVLADRRLAAIEERVRLDLELGRHEAVCPELATMIDENPLRERLYELLMLALYRAGRQAEALEVGRRARARLAEDIGIDPGSALQDLEQGILNRDPALDAPHGTASHVAAPDATASPSPEVTPPTEGPPQAPPGTGKPYAAVPRQLPASIADFTGRRAQIDEIKPLLVTTTGAGAFAVPVVAISGKGGVGKSSLAVRVAHEVAEHYPDGQLYADLQAPNGDDRTAIVLARFLRALGVAGSAVPEAVEERADVYRTQLSGRKMVIVLDDAANAEQVGALLPGSPTCAVISTSRTLLGELPGAHFVNLDVFDMAKSLELLERIIGTERIAAEQEAASELAELCAGLPLALRIAGARLASRPRWRISGLVRRLRDEARLLDELSHHGVELRSTIGLTYDGLTATEQRLFRLFALVDAPDFPSWTAAALLDTSIASAEDVLEGLVDAQLLDTVDYPGADLRRYRFHDLIRVYAAERLAESESDGERREALGRVLGGWLALAEDAHCREYGGDYTIVHGDAARWRPVDAELTDTGGRALDWWESERRGVVAAIRQAAGAGMAELCWDLALTSVTLFESKGYFDDWIATTQLALDVTRSAGNIVGQAAMLHSLGTVHMFQAHLDEAERYFTDAAELFHAEGHEHGYALVVRNAANVDGLRGDVSAMMEKYERALAGLRKVGDRIGEAHVLRSQARYWIESDELDRAAELLEQALAICRDVGGLRAESQVLHRLSELHLVAGRIEEARQALHTVLRIVREIGDRVGEAHALYGLGVVQQREGRLDTARATIAHALELARTIRSRTVETKALYSIGELALAQGRPAEAREHLAAAREMFGEFGGTVWLARSLLLLSEVHSHQGDHETAQQQLRESVRLLQESDAPESRRLLAELDTRKPVSTTGTAGGNAGP